MKVGDKKKWIHDPNSEYRTILSEIGDEPVPCGMKTKYSRIFL